VTIVDIKNKFLNLWDNPSTENDARSILSPFKVGLWLTLFNIAIAIAVLFTFFVLPSEYSFKRMFGMTGMGTILIATVQITLISFFTLILPLRATGLLDGPRWSGYFDQIVSTGITPFRFFLGKWLSSQVFILVIMAASLPYVILFAFFADGALFTPLFHYIEIYLYANFLLLATFALGTLVYEWLAFFSVMSTFSTFIFLEFLPIPSSLMCFTPVRSIISPFAMHLLTSTSDQKTLYLYGDPQLFGVAIPDEMFRIGVWVFFGAAFFFYTIIGPRHFFSKGLNNFDSIVMPGDGRKAMLFRTRPLLTRSTQLAFFYENRNPWLVKHDLIIRVMLRSFIAGCFLLTSIGAILSPDFLKFCRSGFPVFFFLASAWLTVAVVHTVSTIRVQSDFRKAWVTPWGYKTDVVTMDVFLLTAMTLFALVLMRLGFYLCDNELTGLSFRGFLFDSATLVQITLEWVLISFLYLLSVQLVSKLMGVASLSRVVVFFFVKLYMAVSLIGPMIFGGLAAAMARSTPGREPSMILEGISTIAHFSPFARYLMTMEPNKNPFGDSFLASYGFWIYQPLWIILLSLTLIAKLKNRPKDFAETLDGPSPLPPLLNETKEKQLKKQDAKLAEGPSSPTTSVVTLDLAKINGSSNSKAVKATNGASLTATHETQSANNAENAESVESQGESA
jgi:hypothetical protein